MGQLSVDLSARMKDLPLQPKPVSERKGVVFPRYFTAKLEAGRTPYEELPGSCARRVSETTKGR